MIFFKASNLTIRKINSNTEESLVNDNNSDQLIENEDAIEKVRDVSNLESATTPPVRNLKGKLLKKVGILVALIIVFIIATFTKNLNNSSDNLNSPGNLTKTTVH